MHTASWRCHGVARACPNRHAAILGDRQTRRTDSRAFCSPFLSCASVANFILHLRTWHCGGMATACGLSPLLSRSGRFKRAFSIPVFPCLQHPALPGCSIDRTKTHLPTCTSIPHCTRRQSPNGCEHVPLYNRPAFVRQHMSSRQPSCPGFWRGVFLDDRNSPFGRLVAEPATNHHPGLTSLGQVASNCIDKTGRGSTAFFLFPACFHCTQAIPPTPPCCSCDAQSLCCPFFIKSQDDNREDPQSQQRPAGGPAARGGPGALCEPPPISKLRSPTPRFDEGHPTTI